MSLTSVGITWGSAPRIGARCSYRRKVLVSPIDERLKTILAEQIERWGQDLIEMDVLPDHVHLLVGCDPQFGMHRLVKLLKGHHSHALRARSSLY